MLRQPQVHVRLAVLPAELRHEGRHDPAAEAQGRRDLQDAARGGAPRVSTLFSACSTAAVMSRQRS